MLKRDYRDIIGGAVLVAIGLATAVQAWREYPLGTVSHMGSGMFPAGIGGLLVATGVLVVVPALFRPGPELARPDFRSFFFVLLSLIVFAVLVNSFGLIPATLALIVVAVLADNKLGIFATAALAVAMAAVAVLVFQVGLGIPLEPIKWPL